MYKPILKALATGLALVSGVAANIPSEPVYFDAGQYSAALLQSAHTWHLQPLSGDDVEVIDRACAGGMHVPHGVWLVSRDADGAPQLVAPSSTALPAGFPERIPLRACGDSGVGNALHVPPVVLGWIEANVNSVLIDE